MRVESTQNATIFSAPTVEPSGTPPQAMPEAGAIPLMDGDSFTQIAQLLVQQAKSERQEHKLARQAAELSARAAEQQEIAALEEKASHIRAAGWVEGLSSVQSGATSLTVAGLSNKHVLSTKAANDPAAVRIQQNDRWAKGSEVTAGVLRIGSSCYNADQVNDDKDAAAARHAQERAKTQRDEAKDGVRAADDLIAKVLDFLRETNNAKNAANSAALLRH